MTEKENLKLWFNRESFCVLAPVASVPLVIACCVSWSAFDAVLHVQTLAMGANWLWHQDGLRLISCVLEGNSIWTEALRVCLLHRTPTNEWIHGGLNYTWTVCGDESIGALKPLNTLEIGLYIHLYIFISFIVFFGFVCLLVFMWSSWSSFPTPGLQSPSAYLVKPDSSYRPRTPGSKGWKLQHLVLSTSPGSSFLEGVW